MEGTYDLDGDGLKEFASIETSNLRSRDISVVRYYELNKMVTKKCYGNYSLLMDRLEILLTLN